MLDLENWLNECGQNPAIDERSAQFVFEKYIQFNRIDEELGKKEIQASLSPEDAGVCLNKLAHVTLCLDFATPQGCAHPIAQIVSHRK